MSQQLIDHNTDLRRLRDEGYSIEVRQSFLILHHIPYVTESKKVAWGALVSPLHMSGDRVLVPDNHVVHFIGEQPCHKDGRPIQQIMHQVGTVALDQNLSVDRSFSNKPAEGYRDYYHKMSTYADIISGPAFSINPDNTPKKFIAIKTEDSDSIFEYHDTASSRAGIKNITRKLELNRIAIIGLGGTGSYILDLVAKTPVRQIDLYDGDRFYSHNAFRSPGAPSIVELEEQKHKVQFFADIYSRMRRGIVGHPTYLTEDNVSELDGLDFAFVAIDAGEAKRFILESLEEREIPYIDCGMGIEEVNGKLTGQIRTTTSLHNNRSHVWDKNAISFAGDGGDNEYATNIQIADLNALNAVLAVIKWKKVAGFYLDLENELHSIYPIDGNIIINAYQSTSGDETP